MIETAASKSLHADEPRSRGAASPGHAIDQSASTERRGYSVFVWFNLVCLDAPLVAIVWQLLFANAFGIAIARGGSVALFLTAWLIYLADRFGDSLSLGTDRPISVRQAFCLKYRSAWMIAIALVALADFIVVVTQLDTRAILVGGSVGAAAFAYLLINRLSPIVWCVLPLKEISIGFIFAAGTMVGLLRSLTNAAWPASLLFALLCSLNCISIAVWERELDAAQERISIATKFPRVSNFILPALAAICLTSACLALSLNHARAIFLCLASSAILLAVVHLFRRRTQRDVRTALADLVLLTPIVALLG